MQKRRRASSPERAREYRQAGHDDEFVTYVVVDMST